MQAKRLALGMQQYFRNYSLTPLVLLLLLLLTTTNSELA